MQVSSDPNLLTHLGGPEVSTTHKTLWAVSIAVATGALCWAMASAGPVFLTSLCILAALLMVAIWLPHPTHRPMGWFVAAAAAAAALGWAAQRDALDAWPFIALALGGIEVARNESPQPDTGSLTI